MTGLRVPVATYRLQFNRRFRFGDARALVPYLHKLGITDLYTSPLLKARQGSSHGYDVTDPTRLNPELGTAEELKALIQELKRHGMGLLLDIVPNHMAASPENPWWMDVLENGPSSRYASYFDIDWHPAGRPALENRVLLPVLGRPYEEALAEQDLALALDELGFFLRYFELRLPLDPKSYGALLSHRLETLRSALGADDAAFRQFARAIDAVERLPERTTTDPARIEDRRRSQDTIKRSLWRLYDARPEIKEFLDENLRTFNGTRGDATSFDLLDRLLADQPYRLAYWREAMAQLNYRRFFDIGDLICLRAEDPHVFDATHVLILRLAEAGQITGLRIDHVDGLHDPEEYLRRLQSRLETGPDREQRRDSGFYVIVEKILAGDESLPEEWPASGTTGYDFLDSVNRLFVDPEGLEALDELYARFTASEASFAGVRYLRKKQVMEQLFAGEMAGLGEQLSRLAAQDRQGRDFPPAELAQALVEATACLPVYRTYTRDFEVAPRDRAYIERAIEEARRRNPSVAAPVFDFLQRALLLDLPSAPSRRRRHEWLEFVMRWQQLTGPVMAKGVEDTALYVYNRLISLNEVGGDPEGADVRHAVETFHAGNRTRLERWPHTLNATSTHDTKRGEDVRARINVLSELPEEWGGCLDRWSRWNQDRKPVVGGQPVPGPNEELLLYQTLVGAWPLRDQDAPGFSERIKAYMVKASREAKDRTSWIEPDADYERALAAFVDSILDTSTDNRFLADLQEFQGKVAYYGAINSLSQVILKLASPGVPDFYQGTELWDLNLVDPDNRRPVDFQRRTALLGELERRQSESAVPLVRDLLDRWQDGGIKLYLTARALDFRRTNAQLFLRGEYVPLSASGRRKQHIIAFARRRGTAWALIAVARLVVGLAPAGKPPLGQKVWGKSGIALPSEAPARWRNVLTDEALSGRRSGATTVLPVHRIFAELPVALLSGTTDEE